MASRLREQHSGVYLVAKETVQRDNLRYAKAKRRGQAVATAARMVFKACKTLVHGLQALVAKSTAATPITTKVLTPARAVAMAPTAAVSPVVASTPVPSAPTPFAPVPSASGMSQATTKPSSPAKASIRPAGIRAPARRQTMISRVVQPRRLSPHRVIPAPEAGAGSGTLAFPIIVDPFSR
jgi:hypothetical protein